MISNKLYENVMIESYNQSERIRELVNTEEDLSKNLDYLEFLRIFHLSVIKLAKERLEKKTNVLFYLQRNVENPEIEICTTNGELAIISRNFLLKHYSDDEIETLISMNGKLDEAIDHVEKNLPEKIDEALINHDDSKVERTKQHEIKQTLSYDHVTNSDKQETKIRSAGYEDFEEEKHFKEILMKEETDSNNENTFEKQKEYEQESVENEIKEAVNSQEMKSEEEKNILSSDKNIEIDNNSSKYINTFFYDKHVISINKGIKYLINVYPMKYLENDPISTPIFVTVMSEKGNFRAFVSKNTGEKNITMIIENIRLVVRAKWIKGIFSTKISLMDAQNDLEDNLTEIRPIEKMDNSHLVMEHKGQTLHIFPAIFSNDKRTGLCPCIVYVKRENENEIFIPTGLIQTSYERNSSKTLEMYIEGENPILKVSEV